MGFGKRGAAAGYYVAPKDAGDFGRGAGARRGGWGPQGAALYVVPILTVAVIFAVPLAIAGLVDGFSAGEALGVSTAASLPALWILVVLGYRDPHDPVAMRGESLERRFVSAHPAVAGLGGLIGFAWFVMEHDASLWEILASSRDLFGVHRMGEGPLIQDGIEEFLAGVAILALAWHGVIKLAGGRREA